MVFYIKIELIDYVQSLHFVDKSLIGIEIKLTAYKNNILFFVFEYISLLTPSLYWDYIEINELIEVIQN